VTFPDSWAVGDTRDPSTTQLEAEPHLSGSELDEPVEDSL
jgi:hypothetical protein